MRLFRYQNFIKESKEDIHSICKKYGIENYTINEDGSIDVDGDVDFHFKRLGKLPLKFRSVTGQFMCSYNALSTLEGSPLSVGGGFYCNNNQLVSLEGSPLKVGRNFDCCGNKLTTLLGSPKSVSHKFICDSNRLTTLEGISENIGGIIDCRDNHNIKDVKGVKDGWRGIILLTGNPVHEIFKLFPKERWDEVIEYLNEFDVIRDGDLIILQRLEQVFIEMELEVPYIEKILWYKIQF
jgi:hypothetical protein